ncbi:MAG: hypothetical protein HY200_01800 [Nitrospirae bacterium]|nr:hypothetical protein [Nitrospirota bacterium]MBI3593669.1 hypothetical protein [Nitrospirota bacterium]
MKNRIKKLGIIIAFSFSILSCAGQPVRFGELSEPKYDVTKPKIVSSSACGFQLLLLIPINVNSRARLAYDSLVEQAGPDYVVKNIKVQEKWYYALIGTVYCTEFEGTAYPRVLTTGTGT